MNTGLYASEHFETEAVPVIHAYMKRKGKDKEDLKVADVFEGIRFGETLYRDDVNKISYILSSYQDYLDASEEFPDLKSEHGAEKEKLLCLETPKWIFRCLITAIWGSPWEMAGKRSKQWRMISPMM